MPVRKGDESVGAINFPKPKPATPNTKVTTLLQASHERRLCALREELPLNDRQGLHFVPEPHRVAEGAGGNITQPRMPLGQHKRSAARPQPLHIACEDRII